MKFLTILLLKFLLLSNFLMEETIPTKSKILKQSLECFNILDFVGIVSAIRKFDNNKNFKNKIVKNFITF